MAREKVLAWRVAGFSVALPLVAPSDQSVADLLTAREAQRKADSYAYRGFAFELEARSRAFNESSGLPSAGNDDGFAERTLIFLLANRIHGPQLRQQVVDQQSQTRPWRAAHE